MLSSILDNPVFALATVFIIALIVAVVWFLRSRFGQSWEFDVGNRKFKIEWREPAPIPPAPEPELEEEIEPEVIDFAAFAPRSVTPNCHFILDIWAYLPFQYSDLFHIEKELGRDVNVGRKTGVPVSRGALLSIKIDIAQLSVKDSVDTLVWTGQPANTSYIIEVPEDARLGNYPGKATIVYEGLTIAKVLFLVSVSPIRAPNYVDNSSETIYHKTAFASYASQDREEVLSRVQGMKKVAPQLNIFLDVFSLRSGDNWQEKLAQHVPTKDTFFLFWSQHAAQSEWVKREWTLALKKRGLDYIDPVPLEEPDVSPPPDELKELHFSDAYLAYIHYQRRKKEIKKEQARIGASVALRPGRRCNRGHSMDPSWETCPYCEAEMRQRKQYPRSAR